MSDAVFFPGFTAHRIRTAETDIRCVVGGDGPPILLLHGYPQTHVMWHRVAPALAQHYTVVCADLRGYGDSGKPAIRSSARRVFEACDGAGHGRADARRSGTGDFASSATTEAARVAHRLASTIRTRVARLAVLDISPTRTMYANDRPGVRHRLLPLVLPDPAVRSARAADRRRSGVLPALQARRLGHRARASSTLGALAEYERCFSRPGDDPRDLRRLPRRGFDRSRARCGRARREKVALSAARAVGRARHRASVLQAAGRLACSRGRRARTFARLRTLPRRGSAGRDAARAAGVLRRVTNASTFAPRVLLRGDRRSASERYRNERGASRAPNRYDRTARSPNPAWRVCRSFRPSKMPASSGCARCRAS